MGGTGLFTGSCGHCTIIDPLSDGAFLHNLALYQPTTHAVPPRTRRNFPHALHLSQLHVLRLATALDTSLTMRKARSTGPSNNQRSHLTRLAGFLMTMLILRPRLSKRPPGFSGQREKPRRMPCHTPRWSASLRAWIAISSPPISGTMC